MRPGLCVLALLAFCSAVPADDFVLTDAEEAVAEDVQRLIDELESVDFDRNDHRWIEAMMELTDIGPAAIPHIDKVLQETESEKLKRRMLLVLRTFDDVRAVPVVIKYFPRLGEPTGSDMGYYIEDPSPEMERWLVAHCEGKPGRNGLEYDYHRPINEAAATLKRLTGKQFGFGEIRFMSETGDVLRDNAVRDVFHKKAQQWQQWWAEHAKELTGDTRYHDVILPELVEREGPSPLDPGANVTVISRRSNTIVTPIDAEGNYGKCFLDLDTGRQFDGRNRWQGEPREDVVAWAKEQGFDLMAVEREDNGATRYALVPLAAKFWQINRANGKKIESYLGKTDTLVLGLTGDLLLDYDAESKTYGDDPRPAFLYETDFGCVGVIFVDSDVTELFKTDKNGRVLNGGPSGSVPESRGFSYGVKISHHLIGVDAE